MKQVMLFRWQELGCGLSLPEPDERGVLTMLDGTQGGDVELVEERQLVGMSHKFFTSSGGELNPTGVGRVRALGGSML
jgi:hypothetical protein